jgi:signal transduction histidine kinase/ActR/RegA family two-component response regulator
MFLWWGPELVQIYNDAYVPSFGRGKHPAAMGQRGEDCWREAWPLIFPQIHDVMTLAKASWNVDHLVPVWRNGRIEEVYWTYGYSPVFAESGAVGGTLVVCTETTARVVAERRVQALRVLANATAPATTAEEVLAAASDLLAQTTSDSPFALTYLVDPSRAEPVLASSVGLTDAQRAAVDAACRESVVDAAGGEPLLLEAESLGVTLPGGPWPEPSTSAFVVPLTTGSDARAVGFVVFGLSPRLPFDSAYRNHLTQLVKQLALPFARIETYRTKEKTSRERDNLLLQAPVATALFRGPEHVFELANALYCRMVNRSDLVGKRYLEAFPELVGTRLPAVLDRVYQTGEPFSSGEMLIRLDKRGDGTLEDCFFTFNLEALRDDRGSVYGMMAVALEITEQVSARRAIERAQGERESLLRELQAANRAKDEFLAMLGHELRNPLSPIVTALHLMKRRAEGGTTREQEIIERQVGHLVRLVDDLLDVSKITRGKVSLRMEPVEIATVVTRAVEVAGDLFEQRRHRLSVEVPRSGLRVDGDPDRLAQVLANLLTNAARYTPPGGTISVRASSAGDDVLVAVADDGIGIAPDALPRIFEMFVQGHRSADRKEGGLGLGLALVKNLVAMHGGTVEARSAGLGHGSVFEIRLPRTASVALDQEDLRASSVAPVNAVRVLVVDDNVDSAEMLREMLGAVGYDVAIAHDGPSGLALAERFVPDVAVLDIGLEVMDGYEVARRLRESAALAACRLVALTGYGQDTDRARSKAAGFDAHLVKPVDVETLLDALAEGVEGRTGEARLG